jgi:agmatine deiminase
MPTPSARGFRMPAEWEPHAATWIAWPHEASDWPAPGKLMAVQWVYAEVVRHLVGGERVRILVRDAPLAQAARRMLRSAGVDLGQVDFYNWPTDRSWTRDSLPTFVRQPTGERGIVLWQFNGWAKYRNWHQDAAAAEALVRRLRLPVWRPMVPGRRGPVRAVLEGGAIDVNGQGTVMVTEECLLSPIQARNPGLDRAGVERLLADHLGASHVLWLAEGIVGDDTHGHIDDLARFVGPRTVVLASCADRRDPNHARLAANRRRLSRMTDQDGKALRVVELPMPAPLTFGGQRLPASYANFYIGNAAVLVPTFNDPNDRVALDILAGCFPDRRIVGIHAVDLVLGLGTLHCMTQQEPSPRATGRAQPRR